MLKLDVYAMLCDDCRVIEFGAPRASLTELLSKCSSLLLPFSFQVRLILVGFCQRRPGILKTHCFGLVAGDMCHDITDYFSYAGSGCHIGRVDACRWRQDANAPARTPLLHGDNISLVH